MKKFILLPVGYVQPTPEYVSAWMDWFKEIGDCVVDTGNPFEPGKEVTKNGTSDLAYGPDSITAYTIVQAENMEAAVELVKKAPFATAMRVYEAIPM